MKKFLFVALMCLLSTISISAKKRYIEMAFVNFNIILDTGTSHGLQTLKDEKGNPLRFISLPSALNYMSQQGWELFGIKPITKDSDFPDITYILYKDVTEKELDKIASQGFKTKNTKPYNDQ